MAGVTGDGRAVCGAAADGRGAVRRVGLLRRVQPPARRRAGRRRAPAGRRAAPAPARPHRAAQRETGTTLLYNLQHFNIHF